MSGDSETTVISRDWGVLAVKPNFSESIAKERGVPWPKLSREKIKEYEDDLAKGVEAKIFLWPTPVLVNRGSIQDILIFKSHEKTVRLYPPFSVNEVTETSGAFEGVLLPEGRHKLEEWVEIGSSTIKGGHVQHAMLPGLEWCRGFRLDVETGADGLSVLREFLAHVTQFTHQWWLRATHNPMQGPLRMGGEITSDHKIRRELRYEGAGNVESAWYGATQFQEKLGFGKALDKGTWLLSAHHVQEGRKPDQGLLAFYDGMANFMAGNDEKAILNLCIAVEIMLSKHSLIVLDKPPQKLDPLVRKSPLVGNELRTTLKKLVMDRNCVAHGREPRMLRTSEEVTIEKYIHAVKDLVGLYLSSMPTGKWPKAMNLKLDNERIFRGS